MQTHTWFNNFVDVGRRTHTASLLVVQHTVRSTIGDRTSPVTAVIASFLQQTENRTFCPVLQTWLRTSHCADYYYVTSLFKLIVTCPCSLRTSRHAKVNSFFIIIIIIIITAWMFTCLLSVKRLDNASHVNLLFKSFISSISKCLSIVQKHFAQTCWLANILSNICLQGKTHDLQTRKYDISMMSPVAKNT